jgi:hypothetical protein
MENALLNPLNGLASTLVLQEYENCHPEPVEGGHQFLLSYFDRLSMTFAFPLVVEK